MEIRHFLHKHTLKLYENSDFDDLDCSGCRKPLSDETYGCLGCEFFLHKSCAKLPQEIQRFFHPCTLFLRIGSYECNACYSHYSRTFGYRCKECDFDLDVDCARHPTMISESDEDQIQHYSHRHPLKFLAEMGDNEVLCHICESLCSDIAYNCRQCNFYVHKSCMDMLPQKIQIFFHPCQLVLLTTPSYNCDACGKDSSGLTFRCGKCYFQLCVKCFLSSSSTKSEEKQIEHFRREMEIQHFLHDHPLKLYENSDFDDLECSGCANSLSGQTYGCLGCEFFLHKSCAKLPQEIQHFFHPCTLFLRIGSYVCNACYSHYSRTFGYRCKKCDFDLDIDCSRHPTMISEGNKDQVQHYSHRHPLKFLAKMGDNEVLCQICGKPCSDIAYNCRLCNFYLHKSCMDMLPQKIQVFFHPCQLVLLTTPSYSCDACHKRISGLTFRCGKCYFEICVECFLSSSGTESEEKQIKHFSHRHPLMLCEKMEEHEVSCGICGKSCWISSYGCQGCNFYLHKSCMETLYQEIQLFFHPCSLILLSTPSYKCDACWRDRSGVYFRCGSCRFKLCIKCSRMSKMIIDEDDESDDGDRVQHFSHHHPLILFEMRTEYFFESPSCEICGKLCLDSACCCWCDDCHLCFHKSCMDMLPQKIDQHFCHSCPHSCSLILLTTPSYECRACDKNCSGLTFRCGKCQFHLCLECSLLPTIQSGAFEKIQHFLHEHPLILCEKEVVEVPCSVCGTPCLGPTYGCSRCNLFLHKSCAELPQKIRNISHLSHSLTLASQNSKQGGRVISKRSRKARCRLCLKDCCDFAFCCNKCNLQLDVECALLKPTIEYPGHNHRLTVVEKIHDKLECNFCKTCCKDSPAFRCLECNFSLHLLCGPLPCTVKHKCHIDTLTLKDQYVEDDDDDDDFYCDVCERRRDPRLCVYYCAEGCPMIAEVKCVISEVMASLKGKRGDVELRIVGRYISSKMISKELAAEEMGGQNEIVNASKLKYVESEAVLSLDDILVSLDAVERKQLDDIEVAIQQEIGTNITSLESKSDDIYSFAYSEQAFERFMDRLDSVILDYQIPDFILEHEEFIGFQDYLIPRTLIPTFQDLHAKNEGICARSMLSPKAKSLIFYFLCGVIENMRATRIVDITDQKLGEWFACLKWVKYAGFKFQFISEHMKHLAHAHFVVQARKFVEDFPVKLQQKIEQISQEMDKLTAEFRALEDQREFHQRHEKSTRISLKKQFCNVPLAIKWKPAADGLL